MSILVLGIFTLLTAAMLFPERLHAFLHTITSWLTATQKRRKARENRKAEIHRATRTWKAYLEHEHTKLFRSDTLEGKVDQLRLSLAAGQRYLKSVSPDECPSNYKHTDEFCRWAEKKLAEIAIDQWAQ